jgi:hypothetical protein
MAATREERRQKLDSIIGPPVSPANERIYEILLDLLEIVERGIEPNLYLRTLLAEAAVALREVDGQLAEKCRMAAASCLPKNGRIVSVSELEPPIVGDDD